MSMFINNFVQPQAYLPSSTVTTLALGEEGGAIQPPTASTMAYGEEGGVAPQPPAMTTMAVGEEGGGFAPPFAQKALKTQDVNLLRLLGDNSFAGNRDGQLSKTELSAAKAMIDQLKTYMGNYAHPAIQQLSDTANFLVSNANAFNVIAGQDANGTTNGPTPYLPPYTYGGGYSWPSIPNTTNPSTISAADIQKAAINDGDGRYDTILVRYF